MQLTNQERNSDLWRKLESDLKAQLEDVRGELEKTSKTELQTAVLRGRAKQIRELLRLGTSQDKQSATNVTENEYR